jgi:hypothetical protein
MRDRTPLINLLDQKNGLDNGGHFPDHMLPTFLKIFLDFVYFFAYHTFSCCTPYLRKVTKGLT